MLGREIIRSGATWDKRGERNSILHTSPGIIEISPEFEPECHSVFNGEDDWDEIAGAILRVAEVR